MSALARRDKNGRVLKGSPSPNNSNQRRMNRMRDLMDERFGDNSYKLVDHLAKIAFGEMSVRVSKTLKSIRKRQGNDAVYDPNLQESDDDVVVTPSIREMLDATALLLQYHAGKPQQSLDVQVEHTETRQLDFSKLSVTELEAYTKTLEKLAEDNDGIVDGEFSPVDAPPEGDGA